MLPEVKMEAPYLTYLEIDFLVKDVCEVDFKLCTRGNLDLIGEQGNHALITFDFA